MSQVNHDRPIDAAIAINMMAIVSSSMNIVDPLSSTRLLLTKKMVNVWNINDYLSHTKAIAAFDQGRQQNSAHNVTLGPSPTVNSGICYLTTDDERCRMGQHLMRIACYHLYGMNTVTIDYETARVHLERACNLRIVNASHSTNTVENKSVPSTSGSTIPSKWVSPVDIGTTGAHALLGTMYNNGWGVPINKYIARALWSHEIDAIDMTTDVHDELVIDAVASLIPEQLHAMIQMAVLYNDGHDELGIGRDGKRAALLFETARMVLHHHTSLSTPSESKMGINHAIACVDMAVLHSGIYHYCFNMFVVGIPHTNCFFDVIRWIWYAPRLEASIRVVQSSW
jgi:hypothetical protein